MKSIEVTAELVGLATEQDRAWAEHELGFRLPRSYVDFTRSFGRGVLDELVHVFVPTGAVKDNLVSDVRRVLGPGYSPRQRIFRPLPIV